MTQQPLTAGPADTSPQTSSTVVRPVQAFDMDAMIGLMEAIYPKLRADREFTRRYVHWKYLDLEGRDTGLPSAFVAEDEDGPCGFLGCLPFVLRVGEVTSPACWLCDWKLLDRARGRGLGRALMAAAREAIPVIASLNVTEDARRVFQSMGFTTWEAGRNWRLVARPFAYEWPARRGFRKAISVAAALGQAPRARRRTAPGAWSVERVSDVDQLSGILERCPGSGMVRAPGILGWITRYPGGGVIPAVLTNEGTPAGYALLLVDRDHLGRRRGRILELAVVPEFAAEIARAYLAATRTLIADSQVDYVNFLAPNADETRLEAAGFEPRSGVPVWLFSKSPATADSGSWRLSLLDKDNAFRGSDRLP